MCVNFFLRVLLVESWETEGGKWGCAFMKAGPGGSHSLFET